MIPGGQNQAPPFFFSCLGSHFTQMYRPMDAFNYWEVHIYKLGSPVYDVRCVQVTYGKSVLTIVMVLTMCLLFFMFFIN